MNLFKLTANNENESIIKNVFRTIRSLDREKSWQIEIKPYRKNRSREQNAYLWGVVYPAVRNHIEAQCDEVFSVDEIHEYFKHLHSVPKVRSIDSVEICIYKSTAKMTKLEFSDYLERIFLQMANQGCTIPPPEFKWQQNVQEMKL